MLPHFDIICRRCEASDLGSALRNDILELGFMGCDATKALRQVSPADSLLSAACDLWLVTCGWLVDSLLLAVRYLVLATCCCHLLPAACDLWLVTGWLFRWSLLAATCLLLACCYLLASAVCSPHVSTYKQEDRWLEYAALKPALEPLPLQHTVSGAAPLAELDELPPPDMPEEKRPRFELNAVVS